MNENHWMGQLRLSVAEREALERCAESEEMGVAEFARKALWQECRRHLPQVQARRTPLFPPGWPVGEPTEP